MNCVGILPFFFVVLTYALVNNVQASLDGEGIVGGTDANPGEYTYQISLSRGSKHLCGGAIIGYQHIVTAAHCVTDNGVLLNAPTQIIAGVNDLNDRDSSTRVEVNVAKVYIPKIYADSKAWNADGKNEPKRIVGDIAVLLLAKPFDFSLHPTLRKLKLGNAKSAHPLSKAIVSGFGWNHVSTRLNLAAKVVEETGGFSYGKLRFAKTKVLSYEVCSKLFADNYELPPDESHICAQVIQSEDEPEGVCAGDSGGPLVVGGDTLIGVLSNGPTGCHEDVTPAVYTRVSSYRDFIIKAVMNIQDPQILSKQLINY